MTELPPFGTEDAQGTIRFERLLDAPVERVWAYLVEPEKRALWFAGGTTAAGVGEAFTLVFDHDRLSDEPAPYPERFQGAKGKSVAARLTAYEPPHALAFHWGDSDDVTRIELTAQGERTRLVLTQSGLPTPERRAGNSSGWHAHLAALADRVAGRPHPNFWATFEAAEPVYRRRLES